jgi:signal transduction histidine kinase
VVAGFIFSQFAVARLARPVEQLAVDSEQNRAGRQKAEAALESATEELQRSTRYSADASHQLKSPVTLIRAGVEHLLQRENFEPDVYEELSAMLHQTRRLTGVIDALLLLARMDAGHLQIKSQPVNLSELIEEWLDDLSALCETPQVRIEKQVPHELYVSGERQYISLIIQNLLENAWKYNRPDGVLRVVAREKGGDVVLAIGNTGRTILVSEHEHIFERFHRDGAGSAVAGHGLGLNLARELTRLHGGKLRLVRSTDDWTEFEVRFVAVNRLVRPGPAIA